MPKKKATLESLRQALEDVEAEIDAIAIGETDPELVGTQVKLSGLKSQYHSVYHRLCTEEARVAETDKDRVRWEYRAEEADKRHHEWVTQFARVAGKQGNDRRNRILKILDERRAEQDMLLSIPQAG